MKLPTGYKNIPKIQDLIKKSDKILITSHISPDRDAIGSSLAVYNLLKQQYKNKEIKITLESHPSQGLQKLHNVEQIETKPILKTLKTFKPNLLITTDCPTIKRISEQEETLIKYCKNKKFKTIFIDHHSFDDYSHIDFLINNQLASAAEEIYTVFHKKLNYPINKNIGEMILLGILADTGRFLYSNNVFKKTSTIVAELINLGLNIDQIERKFTGTYKPCFVEILTELLSNLTSTKKYNYSYISDKFFNEYIKKQNITSAEYKRVKHHFVDVYLTQFNSVNIGFAVFPKLSKKNVYSCSFRAGPEVNIDTSLIATEINGGGHAKASGGKIRGKSVQEAVQEIQKITEINFEKAQK